MLQKTVLGITGLIFALYGIACIVDPTLPANYAGLGFQNDDARIEVIAMYGGLQTGFGLFLLYAIGSAAHMRSALLATVFLVGALALCRAGAYVLEPGNAAVYTTGAIAFEWITTLLAGFALWRLPE